MKKFTLLIILFFMFHWADAQITTVFENGKEGHKSYRIPAIVALPDGQLLAICEGRVNDADDFGDVNLVMKRSFDKGKTWGKLEMIVDHSTLQAGNPAPVVDMMDKRYPKGRLFLFYNTGNDHEPQIKLGKGIREAWYITSVNGGHTWSAPVNITTQVHRPKQPSVNPGYNFKEDWRAYANTPGHAIQLTKGKYKGRIYIAANHSEGPINYSFKDYKAHGYYSDDHGATFKLSETVEVEGGNECMATELEDGTLMMNIRNQRGDIKARIVALSTKGGQTWDTVYFDKQLPDPVCQGSILTLGKRKGKSVVAFCNALDTLKRDNLTLSLSYDSGRTWTRRILIDKSANGEKDYTAYSDLVKLGRKQVGVLYEQNGYSKIIFKRINL